jgi:hypothetical protein
MKFKIGIDKFPLIEFDESKYTHVFPVTKYQFERYIWETAPDINYDELIKANPRISPDALDKKKLKQLFMTGLSFTEACNFAKWMGGRLPVRKEVEAIYKHLCSMQVEKIFDSIKNSRDMDRRSLIALTKILNLFQNDKVADVIESSKIKELCSEMSFEPYKPIYAKHGSGWSHLVGTDAYDTRIDDTAFRVIIREEF